ncbi:Phosphoribosylformylglycinamidine cyclo-ligase [Planctomycetes bacterium Pan216]|uniref:Phosphoribosylformylglycinamidine cyclo-ligase n=1 Tax=Kolteria novifilia TaxID=2527975 RepID=A0A518BAH9_9BACT|nr:Phosphoribosylformylglycinamidine cyclo-ligase [Planctomycetes bacterium Pan216]
MADEPTAYEQLGVSASKEEVHAAVAQTDPGLYPGAFCRIGPDTLGGDPDWCSALHADGAGTKSIVAYLRFRETGEAKVFRSLAQDALVMNLDDLACVGAVDRFLLANTIDRNSRCVPGAAIEEIIRGYQQCLELLDRQGIRVTPTGGETADVGDSVRTLIVNAVLATRLSRERVVDNSRIQEGDLIIGLSSTGQTTDEDLPNSGIGSNGLTLARHTLLHRSYAEKYPETLAPETDPSVAYRGPFRLEDCPRGLKMTIGEALLSPTRPYAPIVRDVLGTLPGEVHGIVHNTGGGQTKCRSFGDGIAYLKDNLFEVPPLFRLIAEHGEVAWKEMYGTFNMGHRLELMVSPSVANSVIDISRRYGVDAKIVGRCERAEINTVTLATPFGTFTY